MKLQLIGSFFFLFCLFLAAEEPVVRPYRLINSDSLTVEKVNDEYISFLSGNVHFFYGNTEFYSERAELYEKQKISKLIGNVKVYEDTLSLFSDHAEYYRLEEILKLRNNVFVQEDHSDNTVRTFQADRISYHRNEDIVYAWDNVNVYDEREQFYGYCGELTYDKRKGYGYLIKEPKLSVTQNDSLQIEAEKIEYFNNYKKVAATFNVNTSSKDFLITSNFFLYFSDENHGIYLGSPAFHSSFVDATAREFQLFFTDNKLSKAILIDSCLVHYKINEEDSLKQNWVLADSMRFAFDDGKITYCRAFDNIDSFYFQQQTEKNEFMENEVQGNSLIITFSEDNQIDKIHLSDRIKGKYNFFKDK